MRVLIFALVLVLHSVYGVTAPPKYPKDFTVAKQLARQIYRDHKITFYCGCTYNEKNRVDWESCGFQPKTKTRRSHYVEWEHIVPASRFGHLEICWFTKTCLNASGTTLRGRDCCRDRSLKFNCMEADLHNLVPAIGEVNKARSNFDFIENVDALAQFGQCRVFLDKKHRKFGVSGYRLGMIARTYLYMTKTYKIPLTSIEIKTFNNWHKRYPPSNWEKERNRRIYQIQGTFNPYVETLRPQ